MSRQEYDWFMAGEPPGYQIMGNDYYGRNRQPRPVVEACKMLLQEYGQLTIVPHGELFGVGKQPATLKTEV